LWHEHRIALHFPAQLHVDNRLAVSFTVRFFWQAWMWEISNSTLGSNYMQEAKRRRVRHESEPSFIGETYSIGDTVGIRIHKVDRTNTESSILPCKVLEVKKVFIFIFSCFSFFQFFISVGSWILLVQIWISWFVLVDIGILIYTSLNPVQIRIPISTSRILDPTG
jgi:hypothetical protein